MLILQYSYMLQYKQYGHVALLAPTLLTSYLVVALLAVCLVFIGPRNAAPHTKPSNTPTP
jgi:hypothetical protein